jgi:transposase InsO family protein
MRVDNGAPWATWADLPPAFALWLIGLGVKPIWNHPHCPKENAKVERCNGLVGNWGDPAACADFAAWQAHLAHVVVVQREQYRRRDGRTRLEAYPALEQIARPYAAAQEAATFDLERVKKYLAQGRWPRLVSKIGQITLYGKPYRVGRRWVGEQVWLRLDAETIEWVICGKDGEEVIRHPADQITTERIVNLQVAHPRPPSKKKKRQNLTASLPP